MKINHVSINIVFICNFSCSHLLQYMTITAAGCYFKLLSCQNVNQAALCFIKSLADNVESNSETLTAAVIF